MTKSIDIAFKDLESLINKIEEANKSVYAMTNSVVAGAAAETRKEASKIEKQKFETGSQQTKWKYRKKQGKWEKVTYQAKWDSSLGGYVESRNVDTPLRIINFSWENVASKKRKSYQATTRLTSLVANLWEKPTKPYKKNSPHFRRSGNSSNGFWARGVSRPARPYFLTQVYGKAKSCSNIAVKRVEREIGEGKRFINV